MLALRARSVALARTPLIRQQLRLASTSPTETVSGSPDPPSKLHGSTHWTYERAVSAALLPVTGYALVAGGHPVNDALLGVLVPLHCHIGVDAIFTDYFHKRKYPVFSHVTTWGLRVVTAAVMYACYKINTTDVGLTETVARVWRAKDTPEQKEKRILGSSSSSSSSSSV
ncbi:membrane anchor subunit of succinate dehydrogenase, Sdh4 [Sorochytrium milnesiophthora]